MLTPRLCHQHDGSTFRFAASLVFVWLAAALGIAGCGSDDNANAGVVVERPHVFRVELPPNWLVVLPGPTDDDRIPLFSAGSADRKTPPFVVLFADHGPSLEAKAAEWTDLVQFELGPYAREVDASREMMIATGKGIDRATGANQEIVLAVMRSPERPEEMWIFYCLAPNLSKSRCEEIVRGFTLLSSLRIP